MLYQCQSHSPQSLKPSEAQDGPDAPEAPDAPAPSESTQPKKMRKVKVSSKANLRYLDSGYIFLDFNDFQCLATASNGIIWNLTKSWGFDLEE